ncbi:hypothetical protein MRB53_009213 [Persea americana]|uniref:Uncharacterized protein n=1 Tax=Persea americana TaxID=3435 RepID=A0ACC2LNA4_PERAE|nr:hypothetical protein MRB53_009213 [Persea americana]
MSPNEFLWFMSGTKVMSDPSGFNLEPILSKWVLLGHHSAKSHRSSEISSLFGQIGEELQRIRNFKPEKTVARDSFTNCITWSPLLLPRKKTVPLASVDPPELQQKTQIEVLL